MAVRPIDSFLQAGFIMNFGQRTGVIAQAHGGVIAKTDIGEDFHVLSIAVCAKGSNFRLVLCYKFNDIVEVAADFWPHGSWIIATVADGEQGN